ncbi:hypothetical protein EC973_007020 [Apophysomyces ossiformis]|uniref:Protein kinase domain-containing protein n=1 Tax=Apophysomyces ossiformis TaxID=679940 RepID=A0A8H7BSF5_9FUNG|nr:hypothetical protein EC973_007020 [Apophysomyces ossiformis]
MARKGSPHEEYEFLEQIGNGSFGSVHRAKHKATHRIVAVKIMKRKFNSSSECTNLREYKTLKHLTSHPNIVKFYDTFLGPTKELYFIMEFMDGGNLYQLMKERREIKQTFTHHEARHMLRQILAALAHIHQQGIFHRDMKPENLLIGSAADDRLIIKLADFGLARELKSKPPYTEYVSTRWYRAPEVLLRSTSYSYPVDIWAVGAIFAEIITLRPLFPGQSEIDQLYRICELLGSPSDASSGKKKQKSDKRLSPGFSRKRSNTTDAGPSTSIPYPQQGGEEWREGVKLAQKIGFEFPQLPPKPLDSVIPTASASMLDLLQQFLFLDPNRRITANNALLHPLFTNGIIEDKETSRSEGTAEDCNSEKVTLQATQEKVQDVPQLPRKKSKDGMRQRGKSMPLMEPKDLPIKGISDTPAFDLPSIPLSPLQVHSEWCLTRTTSRQSSLRKDTAKESDTNEHEDHFTLDEKESDTDEPLPEECLDSLDIPYQNHPGVFDDIVHQLLKDIDAIDCDPHIDCDITQRLTTKFSEPLLQMRYIREEVSAAEIDADSPRPQKSRLAALNAGKQLGQTNHNSTSRTQPSLSLSASLSTPLESRTKFAHVNVPRKASKANDTKGFSRLFGLRKNSNASKHQPQNLDDVTPSIARTESFPSALFKQFSSNHSGRAATEVKHRRQITRRSSSMMLLSSSPLSSTLASSKPKKLNRLTFWAKKPSELRTFDLMGERSSMAVKNDG